MRRLPLGSLRVFVAVAEHQSFTRAAADLGVTVSAASMQIRSLEQYLGLPLFRRTGRLVELTAEAASLLPKIRDGLQALQSATDDARIVRGSGALHVSMLHSFLLQWLLPRLASFESRYPQIHLHLETSEKAVDLNRTGTHVAIRFGRGDYPGLHSEKLMDEWLVPVCAPDLLRRLGPVESDSDLRRYRLLHSTTEPWSTWRTGSIDDQWPADSIGFSDSVAVVRKAELGDGLALARWSLVACEIARGSLAVASRHATRFARSYYFVCLERSLQLRKVAGFRDWIFSQAAEQPSPESTT